MDFLTDFCDMMADASARLIAGMLTLVIMTALLFSLPLWIGPYIVWRKTESSKKHEKETAAGRPVYPYGFAELKTDELKPCPFCGGKAAFHIHDRYGIECEDCGMGLACIKDTMEEAMEAWNRRADNG